MPRLVNLGVPYGTVAWPDEATDEQISADYDRLEADRQRLIRRSKLENIRLADIVEREQPSWEKTLAATGMNIREGAVGATKQAAGNILRRLSDIVAPQRPMAVPATGGELLPTIAPTPDEPESIGGRLRDYGKGLEQRGSEVLSRAQEETEQLGGGLPAKIGAGFGSMAGASAPALLAAPLGIPGMMVSGGLMGYGNAVSNFKNRLQELNPNLTEEQAFQQAQGPAQFVGLTTAVLSRFGGVERLLDRIVKEGLKAGAVNGILRTMFRAAGGEVLPESLQELAEGLTTKATIDPNLKVKDIINQAGMAGVGAFALGLVTGGGIAIPAAAGAKVVQAVEQGRLRGQSRRESQERIKGVIAEREAKDAAQASVDERQVQFQEADAAERQRLRDMGIKVLEPGDPGYAKTTGIGAQTPSQQAQGVEQEAQERLRLRGATQDRVEAQAGEVIGEIGEPIAHPLVGQTVLVPKKLTTSSEPIDVKVTIEAVERAPDSRTGKRKVGVRFSDGETVEVQMDQQGSKSYTVREAIDQAISRRKGRLSQPVVEAVPGAVAEEQLLSPAINPKQDILLRNFYRAAQAVANRTSYGMRSGVVEEPSYKVSWSNSSKRWDVNQNRLKKGQRADFDANEILVRATTVRDAKLIADSLPPLPLDAFSAENNPALKQPSGQLTPEKLQELVDFWKQDPVSPDVVAATSAFMDKIRSPEQTTDLLSPAEGQFRPRGPDESLIDYAKARREFEASKGRVTQPTYDWTVEEANAAISRQQQELKRAEASKNESRVRYLRFQIAKNQGLLEARAKAEAEYQRLKSIQSEQDLLSPAGKQFTDSQRHAVDVAIGEIKEWIKNDNVSHLENGLDALREEFPAPVARFINRTLMTPGFTIEDVQSMLNDRDLLSPAQKRIPIEIQKADGTRVKGEFNGYYDLRSMGRGTVASVGIETPAGMSHTLLGEGDTIIGTVPTFDQWQAEQQVEDWAKRTTAPGLQRQRLEEATTFITREPPGAAPPVQTAPVTPELRQVDWQSFVTPTLQGNTVDWARLRTEVEAGNLNGGEAGNALLLHLLKRSDLHPVEISILDISPDDTAILTEDGTRFHGRLRLRRGGGPSLIEILTKGFDGKTITQAEFVKTLNHELSHNNISTKHKYASPLIQKDIQDLYNFLVERARGTEFEGHNALLNIDEMFAELHSSPRIQRWASGLDYSQHIRRIGGKPVIVSTPIRNSAFGRFLDIVKRILKLPDFITDPFGNKVDTITALDQAISLSIGLERLARVTAETPLVSYSPAQRVIAGRSAQVQQGINDLLAGKITRDQYNAILQQYQPIRPVGGVPTPASYGEMTHPTEGVKSISKPLVGRGAAIPAGTPVGIRADLPWKVKTGKTAVVVHARDSGSRPGTVLAFEGTGRISNPEFLGSQKESAKIGRGEGRSPFAAIFGRWSSDQSIPADVMNWTQVGFDPTRHSYYYDKSSQEPVIGGAEAIQIAGTVFVRDPVYGPIEETLYSRAEGQVSPVEGLQVTGAAAQLGRVAKDIYADREHGTLSLEGLAFQREQFKTARAELNRLSGIATGRYINEGITPDQIPGGYPNPSEGVSISEDGDVIVADTFSNKLTAMEVDHDKDMVLHHQAEIFFELAAHRLNYLQTKIAASRQTYRFYTELVNQDEKELQKLAKSIAKMEKQAAKLSNASLNGVTIGYRAGEIRATEEQKPFRMAQRDAISLEPVADFFGKQVGGYRAFLVKVQDNLALVNAILDEKTNPSEVARLLEEVNRWKDLPDDIVQAIKAGKPLTDEQRASAFAAMATAFDDFDLSRARMLEMRDSRTPEIDREIAVLWDNLRKSKVESGMGEVMIADVTAALDGETGGTGTLQTQEEVKELRSRLTAILNFAENVGRDLETNGALFEWLANPTSQGTFMIANAEAYGVDPVTLDMIMHEVKRNPAFASAILALVESANSKLANMPVAQIQQIDKLRAEGEVEQAEIIANQLQRQAEARVSIADASIRDALRKIQALEIERMSLHQGVMMFDELASSKEFSSIRDIVSNSPFGWTEPMVEQNNTANTFKTFGSEKPSASAMEWSRLNKKALPKVPFHPGLVLGAADNIVMKAEWFKGVAQWAKAGQEHIDAYEAADAAFRADPANNPSPQVLGFDLAKIRGLKDAVKRFVPGSFLELSLLSEDSRWKVPWMVRKVSKFAWFKQHEFVAKMVGGIPGTDLRSRMADFVNHFLKARHIIQKYRDIPELISDAMKSHPEVRMNMANYREIWNEIAHWGRMFPTPVKDGFTLPLSGITVSAADVALLKRQRKFEEELRRDVTETTPVGGVRVRRSGRDLVRSGAYVGEEGLPRHLNRQSDTFIADVLAAYGETPSAITTATDLSASSTDPIVAFWNRNRKLLVQHVLDSKRQDRAMVLGGFMAKAELSAANDWMVNGVPTINSVDDLVNILASANHFPPNTGLHHREHVIKELNKELRQYRDAARRIHQEREERAQARNSKVTIAFSADNEFTRPAAKLELPSGYYDYGALTPGEHLTITSRANHERVVGYATAVQRAIAELHNRFIRFQEEAKGAAPDDIEALEKKYFTSYGGNRFEAQDVLGMLRRIAKDFDDAYALGNPALTQSEWYREGFGLFTSAVLALPTVGLRNMTQGMFQVYNMARTLGLSGQWMAMRDALLNMPRTLARAGLSVGAKAMRGSDLFATFVTGKNVQVFEKMVYELAAMIGQSDFRDAAKKVNELGYDTRDGFLERFRRIWQSTEETIAPEDIDKAQVNIAGANRKITKLLGVFPKGLRAAFDTIGVQEYDQIINGSLLTYADALTKRLEEVAENYGKARDAQGITEFDPLDTRLQLTPDEWATFQSYQANKDSLAAFRLFLEASASPEGFQLEKGLWDFYQAKKAKQKPKMFTPEQFDAVARRLLSEFNASTPTNRASAAAGNRFWQNLLTLQGYAADGTLKLLNAFGGARDRKSQAAAWVLVPILANLALVSILIGYFQASLTGAWEKWMRGRITSLPDPLDADFWSSWKRWGDGTIRLGLAQLMYIGDIALAFRGEVQGNRGFDPVGKVFPISIGQRAYRTAVGAWNTYKGSGDFSDALTPMADFGRSLVPYWLEAEQLFGISQGVTKQAERLARGEGQLQGLLPENRGFQGPLYGPTTIVRRNLGEAVSALAAAKESGDAAGAQAAVSKAKSEMKKLEDYYTAKYLDKGDDEFVAREKAQKDVWNDYQEINPVVAGLLGKRPTQAQFELLQSGLTGDRGAIFNRGIKAWQLGANELFGREAGVTREDVAEGRAAGAQVRMTPIPGAPRQRGAGGMSSMKTSIRPRMTSIQSAGYLRPARRARRARAIGRSRGPRMRSPRVRTPGQRIAGAPIVQRPKTRLRRLGRISRRTNRRSSLRQPYEFV